MQIFLFYSIPMLSFMNETHFKVLFEFSTIQFALSLPIICLWPQWPCVLCPPLSTKGLLQCFVQDIKDVLYKWMSTEGVETTGEDLPFICYFLLHRKCSELFVTYLSSNIYTYLCQCLVLPVKKEKDACVWQNNLLWLYFLQQSHGANTKYSRDWRSIFIFLIYSFPVLVD